MSESFNVINPSKCRTITNKIHGKTEGLKQKLQNGILLMLMLMNH